MPTRRLVAELVERQRLVDEGVLPAELVAASCDAALRVVGRRHPSPSTPPVEPGATPKPYAPNPALIATIEQTLNQRAGTLTRFFGFVPSHDDTDNVGVIYAIRADPDLSEAQADALVALYEHFAGTP